MTFSEVLRWAEESQLLLFLINLIFSIFIIFLVFSLQKKLKKYRFLLKGNENKELERVLIGLQ